MTPAERETHAKTLCELAGYLLLTSYPRESTAGKKNDATIAACMECADVLLDPAPTCGTCAHWRKSWPNVAGSETGECQNRRALPWALSYVGHDVEGVQTTSNDGCIKGYAPKEPTR